MSEHPLDLPSEAEVEFDCPHCGASQQCAVDKLGGVVYCTECEGAILLPASDKLAKPDSDTREGPVADVAEADGLDEEQDKDGVDSEAGEGQVLDPDPTFEGNPEELKESGNIGAKPVEEQRDEDHGDSAESSLEADPEARRMTGSPEHLDGSLESSREGGVKQTLSGISDNNDSSAGFSQQADEDSGITAQTTDSISAEPPSPSADTESQVSARAKIKLPQRRTGAGLRKEFRQQMDLDGPDGGGGETLVSKGEVKGREPQPLQAEVSQTASADPDDSGTVADPPGAGMAGDPSSKRLDHSVPATSPPDSSPRAAAPKAIRSFVKDPEKERKRLFAAAGIVGDGRLTPVAGLDTFIFRCPDCSQQSVISGDVFGKEISCEECGALLKVPKDDKGRVELVARGCLSDREKRLLTPLPEPGEAMPGEKKSPKLTPLGEVFVQRDADATWGAEKQEVTAPQRHLRALYLIPVAVAAVLVALLVIFSRAPGRVGSDAATGPSERSSLRVVTSGEVDWANIDRTRRIQLATEAVSRFAESESLDDLEAASRPREGLRTSMERHYDMAGGYVSEVRRHGPLMAAQVVESRALPPEQILIVSTRFQDGASGTHALFQAEDGYRVDWDYAVGYSEATIEELREDPPSSSVLMRGYLEEDVFFIHGFTADEWRMFDFHCSQMLSSVVVYVRRGSEVERELREAWTDSGIQRVGLADGPATRLDFTLRLSHLDDGVRKGLVVDEVLTRGWILVE